MNRDLCEKRDQVAKRHDAAIERDPTRATTWFINELRSVVEELECICKEADSFQSDPVEVAKTFRWLGDALFDFGRGEDKNLLGRAAQAYDRAETLLAKQEAPIERAKLDCNYANTLRGLSGGSDVGLLEAAESRYESALNGFVANRLRPQATAVEEMLRTIRIQLGLAREGSRIAKGLADMKKLSERLEGADAFERERIAGELARIKSTLVPGRIQEKLAEAVSEAGAIAKAHPERLPQAPQLMDKLEEQVGQLKTQLSHAQEGTTERNPAYEAEDAFFRMTASMLKQRLTTEEQSGRVSKDRADQLRSVLRRADEVFALQGDDLFTLQKRAAIAREITQTAAQFAMSPSGQTGLTGATTTNAGWQAEPPMRTSRGTRALRILEGLRSRLLAEKTVAMVPEEEAQAGTDLLMRIVTAESGIREYAGDDMRVARTDGEVWRLATDVQAYAARHHLMLTRPIFTTPQKEVDPHSIFISGGEVLRKIAEMLSKRGEILPLMDVGIGGDYAEQRWSQLFSSSAGVFDLGVISSEELAQVCYELGIALAIGKPVVVLSRVAQNLPFDVGLKPYVISRGGDADTDVVLEAICNTLAQPLWGGAEAGLDRAAAEGLRWLKDEHQERLADGSTKIAFRSAEGQIHDATALRRALQQLLGMLGAGAPQISFPAWPPAYPDSTNKPRCFHVMPFRPRWASRTRDLARSVCEKRGWKYVRGDESEEQRIIRAIWSEICSASAVIVDVTNHNPNVALELGLTHAIGRPVRILAQGDVEKHMFPSIQKMQVHRYSSRPDYMGFVEAIDGLVSGVHMRRNLVA